MIQSVTEEIFGNGARFRRGAGQNRAEDARGAGWEEAMGNLQYYEYPPVGLIGIAETDGAVSHLFFAGETPPAGFTVAESPILR